MKNKSLMLLMVAAGCGLVAMLGVQQLLSGGKTTPKTRILVARTEVEAGIQLDASNVGFKEWPADAIPEGAIQTPEDFAERALKHRAVPGQPILVMDLGQKGEYGLGIKIPTDMRIVSLPVTATMTHSGLLRPGNFVDVSAVIETPMRGGGRKTEVKPVLQCIEVFAVGSWVVGTEESKTKAADVKNVSFLVFPLQGQLLQLANKQSNGSLQFALRSGSDKNLVNTRDLSNESLTMLSNSLMGQPDEEEKPAAPKPTETAKSAPSRIAKPKSAFRNYLAPEVSDAMTTAGDQAARRTWKLEIFQGDQREVKEFDWPEESESSSAAPAGGDPWVNPLLKFFDRRQKSEPAVEARPTTVRTADETPEATAQD